MGPHRSLPAPPEILRCGYVELVVTDLAASRAFYVDLLGLVVTAEDDATIHLRSWQEYLHHNLVLRLGPAPAAAVIAHRVATAEDVDRAEAYHRALGCRVERRRSGFTAGIGDAVRVEDPFGFPVEYFHHAAHVPRLVRAYHLQGAAPLVRLDHVNLVTPDVPAATEHLQGLNFRLTEDIRDETGRLLAAWLCRTQTVHDVALTAGEGPRLHHLAFATPETHDVIALCDRLGAVHRTAAIERGPGRHGVSNAFYLYLRDPDGHRVEIYTQDYYTGDPDNPVLSWRVDDEQRRDWWGAPVVPSWYTEASPVLDLDGRPQPARALETVPEMIIGADGFSQQREGTVDAGPADGR